MVNRLSLAVSLVLDVRRTLLIVVGIVFDAIAIALLRKVLRTVEEIGGASKCTYITNLVINELITTYVWRSS